MPLTLNMATLLKFSRVLSPFLVNPLKRACLNKACAISGTRNFSLCRALGSGRKYSEEHEWVLVEGNVGKVGISDYAQDKLGDIVYVQLPDDGAEFDQDDECGALESVKAASEIFSPVSGKVVERNTIVEEKPALINQSCYDEGWLFKIELSKPEEFEELLDEDAYQKFLKSQDED